jgi:predicted NBD/HSP70 family sugar kinase
MLNLVYMIVTVDTGATKTLVAIFTKNGILGEQFKFPTPKNSKKYVKLLRATLTERYSNKNVDAIIIALPGIIKNGVAVWCNNLKWKNFDAASAFRGVLGKVPVFIENDANLAGLAETHEVHPTPALSMYVTISTGIGTGVIVNGKINPSISHCEGGHSIVEFDNKLQEWEAFAAGSAIVRVYGKYAHDITSKKTWGLIVDRISRGFLAIIPVLQPNIIIIGGSVGTYFERYGKQLHKILKEKLPSHIPLPKIVQAKHPEQAVIYGCYYYALDSLADI